MIRRSSRLWKRLLGGVCIVLASWLAFALGSFVVDDPSAFVQVAGPQGLELANVMGSAGAWVAALLIFSFGPVAYLIIEPLFFCGALLLVKGQVTYWVRHVCGFVIVFCAGAIWLFQQQAFFAGIATPGGVVGRFLGSWLSLHVDPLIAHTLVYGALLLGVFLWSGIRWTSFLYRGLQQVGIWLRTVRFCAWCCRSVVRTKELCHAWFRSVTLLLVPLRVWASPAIAGNQIDAEESDGLLEGSEQLLGATSTLPFPPESFVEEQVAGYQCPRLLFTADDAGLRTKEKNETARQRARQLEEKLSFFGVTGKIVSFTVGPVVTLFEYAPAEGVKVGKITALEDDLSLALGALSLRIIAPIPGKCVVGFEVANVVRETITFSALVNGDEFQKFLGPLPLVMGRNVAGKDLVVDLAQLPHVLVAGSTGSGKSVALHAMLMSLLSAKTPDELKLLLIDPKRLEFAAYEGIAHLLTPVVTEMNRVPQFLQYVTCQMDERYRELARVGARSIADYHQLMGKTKMPYLVVVIDELADIMVTVGRYVEPLIARLAQMARAAGIHLIVATQRPSVDVITGMIKVNFPSRVAFKVISKIDSRTILDSAGAELLLGKGDMLFLNAQGTLDRLQGAYVSSPEIAQVVEQIKRQKPPSYIDLNEVRLSEDHGELEQDPLLKEVVIFVRSRGEVSISLIQRQFRIGYNRSARLIELLEAKGVILPASDGKMRKVVQDT